MIFKRNILYHLLLPSVFCKQTSMSSLHKRVQYYSDNMLRLQGVVGHNEQLNNILFVSGKSAGNLKRKHVIFFPGDVQNYRDKMASHFSNNKWTDWCYENTATLLASKFPQAWTWIIEPIKMHDGIFSCYDNFLTANLLGAPENLDNHDALLHLKVLLRSAVTLVNEHLDGTKQEQVCELESDPCENDESPVSTMDSKGINADLPIVIIGFSKGCVVLNQFLHELHLAEDNPELKKFIERISAWYWLDGGHSKETDTWITNEQVLHDLTKLKTTIHVHVTPYQVKDKNRPHIGEEERMFVETLKRIGADVTETIHFEDEERSLTNHFKVLEKLPDD
ncbi:mitochondrial protein C2orf69 homolog [Amphiura filiformis]|uniref:mitochondrial protein C2orf69 homolog n=1 Tax=Amphiura filiformis TaxID=82378 RepID=UPI003B2243E6